MIWQKKESVNLKIDHSRLYNLKDRKDKRMKKNEQSLRDLWDTMKCTNMHIMGVEEEEMNRKII